MKGVTPPRRISAGVKRQLATILSGKILKTQVTRQDKYSRVDLADLLAKDEAVVSSLQKLYEQVADCCPSKDNAFSYYPALGDIWYVANNFDKVDELKQAALRGFVATIVDHEIFKGQKFSHRANKERWAARFKVKVGGNMKQAKPIRGGETYQNVPLPSDTRTRHVREKAGSAVVVSALSEEIGRGELESTAHPDAFMNDDALPIQPSLHEAMTEFSNYQPTQEMKHKTLMQGHSVETDMKLMNKQPTTKTSGYRAKGQYLPPVPKYAGVTETKLSREEKMIAAADSQQTTSRGNVTGEGQQMLNVSVYPNTGQGTGQKTTMGGVPGTNFLLNPAGGMVTGITQDNKEDPNLKKIADPPPTGKREVKERGGGVLQPEGAVPKDETSTSLLQQGANVTVPEGTPSFGAAFFNFYNSKNAQGYRSFLETGATGPADIDKRWNDVLNQLWGDLEPVFDIPGAPGPIKKGVQVAKAGVHGAINTGKLITAPFSEGWEDVDKWLKTIEKVVDKLQSIGNTEAQTLKELIVGEKSKPLAQRSKDTAKKIAELISANPEIAKAVEDETGEKLQSMGGRRKMTLQKRQKSSWERFTNLFRNGDDVAAEDQKEEEEEKAKRRKAAGFGDNTVARLKRDGMEVVEEPPGSGNWMVEKIVGWKDPQALQPTAESTVPQHQQEASEGADQPISLIETGTGSGTSSSLTPSSTSSSSVPPKVPVASGGPPPEPVNIHPAPIPTRARGPRKKKYTTVLKQLADQLDPVYDNLKGALLEQKNSQELLDELEQIAVTRGYPLDADELKVKAQYERNIKKTTAEIENSKKALTNWGSRFTTTFYKTEKTKFKEAKEKLDKFDEKNKLYESKVHHQQIIAELAKRHANGEYKNEADYREAVDKEEKAYSARDSRLRRMGDQLNAEYEESLANENELETEVGGKFSALKNFPELSEYFTNFKDTGVFGAKADAKKAPQLDVKKTSTPQYTQPVPYSIQPGKTGEVPQQPQTNQPQENKQDYKINPDTGKPEYQYWNPDQQPDPTKNGVTQDQNRVNSSGQKPGGEANLTQTVQNQYIPTLRLFFKEGNANIIDQINNNPKVKEDNRKVWNDFNAYDWEANEEMDNDLHKMNIIDEARRFYGPLDKDELMESQNSEAVQEMYNKHCKEVFTFPHNEITDAASLTLTVDSIGAQTTLDENQTDATFHDVYMRAWIEYPESSPWKKFTQVQGTQMSDAYLRDPSSFHSNDRSDDRNENAFIYTTDV